MAWTDNLRAASFRGVPFKVSAHDMTAGRRTVTHEFPLRDKPFTEDMGRRAKGFVIDAYVVGDDYMSARDNLLRACDEPGAAELVHPYLGTLNVVCVGVSLRESASEGRMARFSLSFVETGESEFPSDANDFAARALTSYADAKQMAIAAFAEAFSIDGLPDFAIDDAIEIATTAAEAIADTVRFVNEIREQGIGPMVGRLVSSLSFLVSKPIDLATSIFGLYETVASIFESDDGDYTASPYQGAAGSLSQTQTLSSAGTFSPEQRAAKALVPMFKFSGSENMKPVPTTTATRKKQDANRVALISLVRQAAVIQAAKLAPAAEYETLQDAIAVRDEIADAIDDLSEAPTISDALYSSMQKMRTIVVSGVPAPAENLPSMLTVTPHQTTPSLVLAYDLYEDAARDGEIVMRNKIKHPGFLPGAQPLQVLSDA